MLGATQTVARNFRGGSLIVDVRDNGGGTREPLRILYSYLVAGDDAPLATAVKMLGNTQE